MKSTKYSKTLLEYVILFAIGGTVYYALELLWRGFSHWSMFIAGGLCFILIGLINYRYEYDMSIVSQTVVAGLMITAVELLFGLVFNIWLGFDVWDYSHLPYNFMGQICLSFVYIWQWLSAVAIVLDDFVRWKLFGEDKPHYRIF